MRTTGDDDRIDTNDPKANCNDKGSNKASDIVFDHDNPKWETQWTTFTKNYYEAIGGYIAPLGNENHPEY